MPTITVRREEWVPFDRPISDPHPSIAELPPDGAHERWATVVRTQKLLTVGGDAPTLAQAQAPSIHGSTSEDRWRRLGIRGVFERPSGHEYSTDGRQMVGFPGKPGGGQYDSMGEYYEQHRDEE